MKQQKLWQRGFTFIELLISIAVMGILIIALTMFVGRSFNISREQFEQVRITEDARKEIERIGDTLRNANNVLGSQSETTAGWLKSAGNYTVTIYGNADSDAALEEITYALSAGSTDLQRTVADVGGGNGVTTTLVRTMRNRQSTVLSATPLFTYYGFGPAGTATQLTPANDSDSLSVASMSQVARVGIRLVIDVNEQQHPGAVNITTDVTPRVVTAGIGSGSTPPACSDNTDNDGDTFIDLTDPGCSTSSDTSETNEPACSDDADNDGDTYVDASDPGCYSSGGQYQANHNDESDAGPPSGDPHCNDGIDNDLDGLADVDDPGCLHPATGEYVPEDTSELGITQCDNSEDEDGTGDNTRYIDDGSGDPDCNSPADDDESTPPASCPTFSIGYGQTIAGTLTDDCIYDTVNNDEFQGWAHRYADYYTFTVPTSQAVKIRVKALNRDNAYPQLYLLRGTGETATAVTEAASPCFTETGTFSKVCLPADLAQFKQGITLAPDTYTIVVTSKYGEETFDYDVSLLTIPVPCSTVPLALTTTGVTEAATLEEIDCQYVDQSGTTTNQFADLYTFTVSGASPATPKKIQITMQATSGTGMQPNLYLKRDNTAVTSQTDYFCDSINTNKVCIPVNPGAGGSYSLTVNGVYTIVATSAAPKSFPYNLTLKEYVPPPCSNTQLTLSTTLQTTPGSLTSADCFSTGFPNNREDHFRFTGAAGDQVQISMTTTGWPQKQPYLYLKNNNGTPIAESVAECFTYNDAYIPCIWYHSFSSVTLPATGEYTIIATSWHSNPQYPINYSLKLQKVGP